ncbi:MAG: T9SS type A sorting domain-containing protein [Aureispira sp.]|nr:T9SS type A sorting domain-containing protein [Aureispira sp.]
MYKSIIYSVLGLIPCIGFGQGLVNAGMTINQSSGMSIYVDQGGVSNLQGGQINNEGTLYLEKDWTQSGAGTGYSGNGMLRFEGATNQQISGLTSVTNLHVNNGNKLTLGSALSISNTIDLNNNGSVELSNNNLVLSSGAILSGYDANNYIITNGTGTFTRQVGSSSMVFPVGNSIYNPLSISNNGTVDNFNVRVEDAVYQNGTSGSLVSSNVVRKTWFVGEETAGGSDITVTPQWNTSDEGSSFDRNNSGVAYWNGSAWNHPASLGAANNLTATTWNIARNSVTQVGVFVIEDAQPIGVEQLADGRESNISLFPNPAKDYLNIQFDGLVVPVTSLRIYAANGQLVYQEQVQIEDDQVLMLDVVQKLAASTYTLVIGFEDGKYLTKEFVRAL